MELTTQRLFLMAAAIAFAAGAALAVMALRCYVRYDIRGVRDDLSGRMRQRMLAEQHVYATLLGGANADDAAHVCLGAYNQEQRRGADDAAMSNSGDEETLCHLGHDGAGVDDEAPTEISALGDGGLSGDFELITDVCVTHAEGIDCGEWGDCA